MNSTCAGTRLICRHPVHKIYTIESQQLYSNPEPARLRCSPRSTFSIALRKRLTIDVRLLRTYVPSTTRNYRPQCLYSSDSGLKVRSGSAHRTTCLESYQLYEWAIAAGFPTLLTDTMMELTKAVSVVIDQACNQRD